VLPLAYTLSLLTYVVGAVLYGSPIPAKFVKKWGVLMMYDGIASAVLVSAYGLVIRLGDYLLSVVNADWGAFTVWLTSRTGVIASTYLLVQSLGAMLKVSGAEVFLEILKHVGSLLATTLTSIKTIYLISVVVYSLRDKILAVGVLLYSLPLRVGRGVGAALVAASIVYYIGLPLMPAFAAIFEAPPIVTPSGGLGSIRGRVVDALGNPLPNAVVELYGSGSAEPDAVVVGDTTGAFYVGPPYDIMAEGTTFTPSVVFMGYRFTPDPSHLEVSWEGHLRVYNLVYAGQGLTLVLVGVFYIGDLSRVGSKLTVPLEVLSEAASVTILKLSSVNVSSVVVNGESLECSWDEFSWAGMTLEECYLSLSRGSYVVELDYLGVEYPRPAVAEKRYLGMVNLLDYLISLQVVAVSYVYSYLLLPSAYLVVLSASTYALSKFLGGGLRFRLI